MQLKKLMHMLMALTLILSTFLSILIWNVEAEPAPTLTLSETSGKVGEVISINGTIDTENGFYEIRFNGTVVERGTAIGNRVTNFTVPELPAGRYNVTLYDVNASSESQPASFTIETAYILDIVNKPEKPHQFMEGDNITISITIKGGESAESCPLNVTVTIHGMVSYNLTTLETNENGTATGSVIYPSDFLPLNFTGKASTNYTGVYVVKLNETLANPANFTVGITDRVKYHRGDTLVIHAAGYQSNETAVINIKFPKKDETVKINVNASSSGIIHLENETILLKAPMGGYKVWINGTKTTKKLPDEQTFTVPGFTVIIPVKNLHGDPVPGLTLKISENETNFQNETITAENGEATINLEKGNYTWRAIYKEKFVGEGNLTTYGIENETVSSLIASLSVLNVNVIEERTGKGVPFAYIKLFCNYTTVNDENRSLTLNEETDVNGTAKFVNVFVNESYTIQAYKYDALFSQTIFFTELPEKPLYSINVTYPVKTLIVKISDCADNPAQGMIVRAYEWTAGISTSVDEKVSDENGTVTLNLSFGWYRLRIFNSTKAGLILVNETKAVLTAQNETVKMNIKCKLLGLDVTVRVVDFLGIPLPNVTVKLELASTNLSFSKTGGGEFSFRNIIGGKYKILVYLPNSETPYLMDTVYLNSSSAMVTLRDGDHVNFFGILIETNAFVTTIILIVAVTITAVVAAYRRLSRRWIGKEKV